MGVFIMEIGINAAASIKYPRTGVEEYTYQLIKHLAMLPEARQHRFLLYIPDTNTRMGTNDTKNKSEVPSFEKGGLGRIYKSSKIPPSLPPKGETNDYFDFPLPENFEVKKLAWSLSMWTQVRLAWEMLNHKPEVLFIPVHILPRFHPQNSVVTIHGLEYEYFPQYYPFWFRQYLRFGTKYAVKKARKIIAVSENTKKDLIKFYGAETEKVEVVHHGIEIRNPKSEIRNNFQNSNIKFSKPYFLYIGRLELKKNIIGILEAYKILKEKYGVPHELVLVGPPGFGYKKIKSMIHDSRFIIHELGYISEDDKWDLLRHAEVFLFPSFYEGFGMPILEAQAAGVPVVTSNISSMPEVVGDDAFLVDPHKSEEITQAVYRLIDDRQLHDKLIQLGYENIKRFSWEKCARETLRILLK